jgi:predicted glycoside hydrolase/deacetylase ChbG (UPF0249 family)
MSAGGAYLTVNADDFGFTRGVNLGIVAAHREGILTATTLMANGPAFGHAVELARDTPGLDIGCHLVLVGGASLLRPGRPLPASVPELLVAITRRRLHPRDELRPQIEKILAAGLRPLHLDTHKHTHLWPPVLDAVAQLAAEYRIPWVRRPFDLPLSGSPAEVPWSKRAVNRGVALLRRRMQAVLARHGLRTTDHFAGFQITGRYRSRELAHLIEHLPAGLTEFMCHPGYCDEELRSAPTRLQDSREQELRALTAPEVRAALERRAVTLVRYSALS